MSKFCRDREFVLSFWKQASKDSGCPWVLRVYCINELAKSAKIAMEFPPIPGTYRPSKLLETNSEVSADLPTDIDVAAAKTLADTKDFLRQLGGADVQT
jgi:hypothetical protein